MPRLQAKEIQAGVSTANQDLHKHADAINDLAHKVLIVFICISCLISFLLHLMGFQHITLFLAAISLIKLKQGILCCSSSVYGSFQHVHAVDIHHQL